MNKKFGFMFILSTISLVCLVALTNNNNYLKINATTQNTYTLNIKDPLYNGENTSSSESTFVKTTLNNNIQISYKNLKKVDGYLNAMERDGYIANDDALCGLISIHVVFDAKSEYDTLFLEYYDSSSSEINSTVVFSDDTFFFPSNVDTFKLSNLDNYDFYIKSIVLNYTCSKINVWPEYLQAEIVDNEAVITKYIGPNAGTRNVVIPSHYQGYPVTSIAPGVFRGKYSLGGITIPSTITKIDDNTFKNCARLEKVNLPSTITSIGNSAFENCYKLIKIELPLNLTSLGDRSFYDCEALTYIETPAALRSVGSDCFMSCESLMVYHKDSVYSYKYFGAKYHLHADKYVNFMSYANSMLATFNPSPHAYGVISPIIKTQSCGGNSYFEYVECLDTNNSPYITILASSINNTTITIPQKIDGIPIKVIAQGAFKNKGIKEINVSNSAIETIAQYAFANNPINYFDFAKGLKYIGYKSFAYSGTGINNTWVCFPSTLYCVGNYAFDGAELYVEFVGIPSKPSTWQSYWNSGANYSKFVFIRQ